MSATTRTPTKTSHDLPKPDEDLAEWTSRIKAMARQADADEEAEQLKLEEEIAAARRNRARRSRGLSAGRSESLGSGTQCYVLGEPYLFDGSTQTRTSRVVVNCRRSCIHRCSKVDRGSSGCSRNGAAQAHGH